MAFFAITVYANNAQDPEIPTPMVSAPKPISEKDYVSPFVNKSSEKIESEHIVQFITQAKIQSGIDIAVLVVDSTKPETIEQFSIKTAESWKVGEKKKDNGILVIIATKDRKSRIEVGYGLEGVITDAISTRILSEYANPFFKNNDFKGGILEIIGKLKNVKDGKKVTDPIVFKADNTVVQKSYSTGSSGSSGFGNVISDVASSDAGGEIIAVLIIIGLIVALFSYKFGWVVFLAIVAGSIFYFVGNKLPFIVRGILGGAFVGGIASFWLSGWDLVAIIAAGAITSMISIINILWLLFSILSSIRGGGSSGGSRGGSSGGGGGGGRFGGGGGSSGW